MNVIEAHNLSIGYRSSKRRMSVVHRSLDIALRDSSLTCLLGRNGCGKSTLLRTLCGLQPKISGEILLEGKPLEEFSQNALSMRLGAVLTERTNAGGITVRELVSLGRYPHTGFFGTLREEDYDIVDSALQSVSLSDKAGRYVSELSDGERQKAFIAKALAQECPVMVLDEPTAFLDVTSRYEIMALLKNLASQRHKTVLLSTHDLDCALQMADELWLLGADGALKCGTPEKLVADGSLAEFFSSASVRFNSILGKFEIIC